MQVSNMKGRSGNVVPNQFIIEDHETNTTYFQSYRSIIAKVHEGKVTLDGYYWNYSVTTSKYLARFLGETTKEIKAKLNNGTYKLENLN